MTAGQLGPANGLVIHCIGCGHGHRFDARWTVTSIDPLHIVPSHLQTGAQGRCHLNVLEGKIHFAADSDHALKGTIVDVAPAWVHWG